MKRYAADSDEAKIRDRGVVAQIFLDLRYGGLVSTSSRKLRDFVLSEEKPFYPQFSHNSACRNVSSFTYLIRPLPRPYSSCNRPGFLWHSVSLDPKYEVKSAKYYTGICDKVLVLTLVLSMSCELTKSCSLSRYLLVLC